MLLYNRLLVIACLAASASALNKIKCYQCNSETDANCDDPINTERIKPTECTNELTNNILSTFNSGLKGLSNFFNLDKTPQIDATFACLKLSVSKNVDGKDRKMVMRSCVLESTKFCDSVNKNMKVEGQTEVFCQECNSDECNAGSSLSAALALLIPTIALILSRQ